MITPDELAIWQDRWVSLSETLTALEKSYWNKEWDPLSETLTAEEKSDLDQKPVFPRQKTLYYLVKSLNLFADKLFQYFYNGFVWGYLDQSSEYPPEYALSTILNQVSFDLEIIQRIEQQRRGVHTDALDRADKLAQKALQPVLGSDKLIKNSDTTVLTYFQKSASIRIVPYAPVALIGVPFTAAAVPQDFLAIPHEAGHYVYRNGKLNDGKPIPVALDEQLEADSPAEYVKKWVEEIFADVYGCLITGPVIALDFQDLQLENSGKDFTEDDGDHPVSFTRPDLYSHVLAKMTRFPRSLGQLKNRWEGKLDKRGNPNKFTAVIRKENGEEIPGEVSRDEARGQIEAVIDKIWGKLPEEPTEPWSADLNVEELYNRFSSNIDTLITGVTVAELTRVEDVSLPAEAQSGVEVGKNEPLSKSGVGVEVWEKVLDADGWNTQGPNGRGG